MQVRIRQVSRTRRDPRQYGLHLIYVDHQIGFFQTIDEETYKQLSKEPANWTDVASNYDKNSNSSFSEHQANRLTPKLIQLLEENMYTDIAAHFKLKGEKYFSHVCYSDLFHIRNFANRNEHLKHLTQ